MRILIHLEGGIVQGINSDEPCNAEVFVLDYDTLGSYPDNLHKVPQSDKPGDTRDAYLDYHGTPDMLNPCIVSLLDDWQKQNSEKYRPECISCCHELVCKEDLKKNKSGDCPFYEEDNF